MGLTTSEPGGWEKSLIAAGKVRERTSRAARALNAAGVPYAMAGGNAVGEWVATLDDGAVRNTRDVDLLVNRADLPAVQAALEGAGFVDRGPDRVGKVDVRILFAGECSHSDAVIPQLKLDESERLGGQAVVNLAALLIRR